MSGQRHWLFETPLAHKMGENSHSYFNYHPELEVERALQQELEAVYHGGKIAVSWTPFMDFAKDRNEYRGQRGVYIINFKGRSSYVGRSYGSNDIKARLQKFNIGIKNSRANMRDFTVKLGLMPKATQKQIDLVEHLLIRRINTRLQSQHRGLLTNVQKTKPFRLQKGAVIINRGAKIPSIPVPRTRLRPGIKELEYEQLFY